MNMRSLVPWNRNRAVTAPRTADDSNPLVALHRQMDRLFDDVFRDFGLPPHPGEAWPGHGPSVDVSESDDAVIVSAELPGMTEKDIEVTWRDGALTLKGDKQIETNGSVYSERWHGRFERTLQLGPEIDPDKVKADFKNGLLTVRLEKRPDAQKHVRRIAING